MTDASGRIDVSARPRCVDREGFRIRTFESQSHGFGTGTVVARNHAAYRLLSAAFLAHSTNSRTTAFSPIAVRRFT